MARFNKSYLDWIDNPEEGFYITNAWNMETGKEMGVGRLVLSDRQRKIFGYALQQNEDGKFRYQTIINSDIKKSGKSTISASIIAWYLECAPPDTKVIICANSLEQSERLIFSDVAFHYKQNMKAKVLKDKIEMPNGSEVFTLSKNYTSASGTRHALTVWDELYGAVSEDDRRRWDELTPIPTVTHSLRLVSSYAGFYGESELLYELYLRGVDINEHQDGQGKQVEFLAPLPCYENGDLFTYWGHEPHMPWQNEVYYDSQRISERPNAYLRLHENRWTTSREIFIPIEWWDAASAHFQQSADIWKDHPYYKYPVYIAVDAASKRDCTAVVGVAADSRNGKIALLFHKIWTPVEGTDTPLDLEATLEPYILEMSKRFKVKDIVCDPAHMYQIITRLRNKNLPVHEFSQVDSSMVEASTHLYDLLRQDNLWAYPSDDIREHLQNVMAEYTNRGLRIVKDKSNSRLARKKIDAAVALAMACHRAYCDVGREQAEPIIIESNFSSMSAWGSVNREPDYIPAPLRSD